MTYFITGGTGSFGSNLVHYLVGRTDHDVVVFSRDELKQWEMAKTVPAGRVRFIIGDVRDRDAVERAVLDTYPEYIIHAAALKHIHTGEVHPWETLRTNVEGTRNVMLAAGLVDAAALLISTDKAVEPVNLYGASKMAAERITIVAGQRVARWGNVFGSRGSVLHIFQREAERGGVFSITDKRMTRFVITLEQTAQYALQAVDMEPGNIFIPELPAIRITDLALAFDPAAEFREIGVQPGEKLAESLAPGVTSDTARLLSIAEIRELINATL